MNNKILFFDVDNTLVDHFENRVQPSTKLALQKLIDNKHEIVICTGKPPSYIKELETLLDIEIHSFICLNGNYIVYQDELIYDLKIDELLLEDFINYCTNNNIFYSLLNENGIYTIFKNIDIIKDYYDYFNAPYPTLIDEINLNEYHQLSVMHNLSELEVIGSLYPDFDFIKMNDHGMNIVLRTSGKGNGIKKYLQFTNSRIEDTICFGDGLNDIEMFKVVKTSVAMGNADEGLKKYATLITDHISKDGLYNACVELGLIA